MRDVVDLIDFSHMRDVVDLIDFSHCLPDEPIGIEALHPQGVSTAVETAEDRHAGHAQSRGHPREGQAQAGHREGPHRSPSVGHRPAPAPAAEFREADLKVLRHAFDDVGEGRQGDRPCRGRRGPLGDPEKLLHEGATPQHPLVKGPALAPAAEGREGSPSPGAAPEAAPLEVRAAPLAEPRRHEGPVPALGDAAGRRKLPQDRLHGLPGTGDAI